MAGLLGLGALVVTFAAWITGTPWALVPNRLWQLSIQVISPALFFEPGDPVPELSGLVASSHDPELFWSLGDSGTGAYLYTARIAQREDETSESRLRAIGLQQWKIVGATNEDWEALAMDGDGRLLVADIGNNFDLRDFVTMYRVHQPESIPPVSNQPIELAVQDVVQLRYSTLPGGQDDVVDAEASFWCDGWIYLISKRRRANQCDLYRFPETAFRPANQAPGVARLERVGQRKLHASKHEYGALVTAASIDREHHRLAMMTYDAVYLFDISPDTPGEPPRVDFSRPLAFMFLPAEEAGQREAIVWRGQALYTASEDNQVIRVDVPGFDRLVLPDR